MLKDFNQKLFKKNDKLLLAISGGIDSMVMLDNMNELAKTKNLKLMVAHVDHQKRKTSSVDCAFVKDTCQKLGIPFFSKALEYIDIDNFHDYARTLRYEFFYNVAKENDIQKLVLAHNKNDNAETILMRLARGSSFEGYRGILEQSMYKDLVILRPLINVSRKEISIYQQKHEINFREDESNAKDIYTRNRFRHNILPLFEKENPKYLDKMNQFSDYITYAYEIIHKGAKQFIKNNVKKAKGIYKLSCSDIKKADKIIQIEVVKTIINLLTENSIELSYQNLMDIIKLIENKKPNLELTLPGNLYVYKSYDLMSFQTFENTSKDYEFTINSFDEIKLNSIDLFVITKNHSIYTGNIYKLCYNILDQIFPLTIRNRRQGDKVKIKSGTKKVKDLFIDKKVPISERNSLPIVLDKNQEIIWIPNYYSKKTNGKETVYLIYQKG